MRADFAIDDELLAQAKEYAGMMEDEDVVRKALQVYIQSEAGRRLAEIGGTDSDAKAPPRRRSPDFFNNDSG